MTAPDVDALLAEARAALDKGSPDEAARLANLALEAEPENYRVPYTFGVIAYTCGKYADAAAFYKHAIDHAPTNGESLFGYGLSMLRLGEPREALGAFRKVRMIYPKFPGVHNDMGLALHALGHLEEAKVSLTEAVHLDPSSPDPWNNLGNVLREQGRTVEAVKAYEEALSRRPEYTLSASNRLLAMLYSGAWSPEDTADAHRKWAESLSAGVGERPDVQVELKRDRRLRIGYVSPDFRTHSVSYFFEPILDSHDRNLFEVYCYANVVRPDETTERLAGHADVWRDILAVPDQTVAAAIADDHIDILVDLAGHTNNGRLSLFLYKPAPVQVTYLGYPCTTGLPTIDYRITDGRADPPGAESLHTEKLVRLDGCFLCYAPPPNAPPVSPSPCVSRGHVTYVSFNVLPKLTPQVIGVWSRILGSVPGSRLALKAHALLDKGTRERIYGLFAESGITRDRIDTAGMIPSKEDHLALYGHADIALDPFPYNGTTTTCEALWMGVPVVTLKGRTHAGRVGHSILSTIGANDLAASSIDEYVSAAVALAASPDRLSEFRTTIRSRIAASPLCDRRRFTRGLETAYQTMWHTWIDS